MRVDVATSVVIARPRETVAAYASDPDNATNWYENIKSIEWKTAKPLVVGSRVTFVAMFLGRRLSYTYEIREYEAGRLLIQSTSDGPFSMETTYRFETADERDGGE
jgi:ligand-binding SRPBCC domain-containing protein